MGGHLAQKSELRAHQMAPECGVPVTLARLEGRSKSSCWSALMLVPLGDSLPGSGERELPGSGVHLSVWRKSQEFSEAVGSATEGAVPRTGRTSSRAPTQVPVQGTDPRNGLQLFRYPLGGLRRSLRSGVHCRVAHRGYDVHVGHFLLFLRYFKVRSFTVPLEPMSCGFGKQKDHLYFCGGGTMYLHPSS